MPIDPKSIVWDDEAPPPATGDQPSAQPDPQAVQWDSPPATRAEAENPEFQSKAPIIVAAVRAKPVTSQEVNPTFSEAGFADQLTPDPHYHSELSDADKKEYAAFFKDPKSPPTAAALGLWYHQKTGAYLTNAQDIVDTFRKLGKFSTAERIVLPTKHKSAAAAGLEHISNAVAQDFGPELAAPLDALGLGGEDRPNVWNSDESFGHLLANNADLERAQLEQDSADHPVASIAGELTGAGLSAPLAGAAMDAAGVARLAAKAPRTASALKAGVQGAAYGAGAAGPGDRFAGALTGAALGSATDAAIPLVSKLRSKPVASPEAVDAAAAAADLGIDLPRFVVGGSRDARKASALEQTAGGVKPISDATSKMLDDAEAARTAIAGDVGRASEPAAIGDEASEAAIGRVKAQRQRIGGIYDAARHAAGDTMFEATDTERTLQQLVGQEANTLGGTKTGQVLNSLLADLKARQGKLTIDGARATRTELRARLRDEAGVTPDNADRLTNVVMGSINHDIESGLLDTGNHAAVDLYRQADREWAQQRTLEDDVLKPFLGKDMNAWGEEVARRINSDAKGNGTRLARFLGALPDESANNVRASIIMHLGSASAGAQNAAGDAFSLDTFLTNWNQLKGARNLVFPQGTVDALDKLARIAEVAKAAGRTRNRSNTGGVISYLSNSRMTMLGAAETALTGDPKGIALGLLLNGLNAARQYGAAKLLASPAFARKLASTPLNPKGAAAFWARPWVKVMAVKNPSIAAEIQAFQRAVLTPANDNGMVSGAVASPDPDEETQDQQANAR